MMKKYICMALVAMMTIAFSACSNEDIQIDQSLTIKVDMRGVIAPFSYEVNKGELSALGDGLQLRTRLIVYNDLGKSVFSKVEYFGGYNNDMQAAPNLPNGNYTMVVITDVIANNGGYEYWTLSNESELKQMRLDAVKDLDANRNEVLRQGYKASILGIESKKVTINASTRTVELKPKAAGSILCVHFKGFKKFSNLMQLQFRSNQTIDYVTFNANGEMVPSSNRSDGNKLGHLMCYFNPQKIESEAYVYYFFVLPSDINMAFAYAFSGDKNTHYVGGQADGTMSQTVGRGEEYEVYLDLDNTNDITVDPKFGCRKASTN